MKKRIAVDTAKLEGSYGIVYMGRDSRAPMFYGYPEKLAFDAQPGLVTTANSGILSLFTTYVEPEVIEILVRPTKAATLYGETKKGTWVSDTIAFIEAERTGEVTSYGDFSNDGMSDANIEFPQRQSYHYQTNTRWGEREIARAAEAKVDLANWKQRSSALSIEKYQNYAYLNGIAGLQNYGGTNDPFLPAPIAPTLNWYQQTDPTMIFGDMLRLVQQAIAQGNGLVDTNTNFRFGISPGNQSNFSKTNQFNYNVNDMIRKNFPNLEIVTVPEFAINGGGAVTGGTEFLQLIATIPEAGKTVEAAFTEKMRAHAMVVKESSWQQKKSAGTWGVVFYRPVLVASMLG
jgi:hypothetical protein